MLACQSLYALRRRSNGMDSLCEVRMPNGGDVKRITCITLPARVWMDRRQALAALEWRKLQCRASPSLAQRRPRPRDLADSPDTQCAPAGDWRGRLTAALPMTRPQAV